jgi:anti-repressor protein
MSTSEIAELTGKRHDNVMRGFRDVCEALEIDQLSFESMYPDTYGRKQLQYKLPKDLTTTLVSGYST